MQINCSLVGANFRSSEAKDALRTTGIGDILGLEADPDNEYDSSAVRVTLGQHHVGFIPRAINGPIFEQLIAGETLTATIVAFNSPLSPILEIEL